ncbi:type II secretion system F family protein [Candidatus Micrarchaeota archaeon]|nr:type II secretion system F family protein [Candidatus Micrarchaeota archaeon]
MMFEAFLETLGRIFSREQVKGFGKQLYAAGIFVAPEAFAGYLIITGITSILFLTSVLFLFADTNAIFTALLADMIKGFELSAETTSVLTLISIFLFSILAILFCMYFIVGSVMVVRSEARKNAVESVLPDFLTLVGANVRAGMTLDQAMWYAARPEFGVLSIEVRNVIKDVFGGAPFNSALDRLAERFDSKILQRTINLIKQAAATGGEVAKIFEITAADAKETAMLRKDIAATLLMYEIFVVFAACVGAPFLFAVMGRLISEVHNSFQFAPSTFVQSLGGVALSISTPLIGPNDFALFSVAVLFLNALISAFMIGIIRKGTRKEGLKYFPVMLISAYVIYWLISVLLDAFLAGIIMRRVVV